MILLNRTVSMTLTSVLVTGTLLLCMPPGAPAKIVFKSLRDGGENTPTTQAIARQFLKTPKKWRIRSACWIDNGQQVLLAAENITDPEKQFDIYRYHLITGKLTNLTNHPGDDLAPDWISDTVFSVTPLKNPGGWQDDLTQKAIQWGTLKQRNTP